MTRRGLASIRRTPWPVRWLALVAIALALVAGSGTAGADNVDNLIGQLKGGTDYKVRLSAALSLAKLGDTRAIRPFSDALLRDGDKTVRGAAAVGLAKLVDGTTSRSDRKYAIDALVKASNGDPNAFVKKQAEKALSAIRAIDDAAQVVAGGIYVDVGAMSAKTDGGEPMRALMKKTTTKALNKNARDMMTAWPGGGTPSRGQLEAKKTSAYHVDGTLTELGVKEKGSTAVVSCKISMLIATYPEKSMFGFLNGGASVQASAAPDDIELAKQDCVVAVVEDLVVKKIIPTIKTRSGQ